ncbi:hypothetical protein ACJMK2_044594 [Sinanodonta woodiana]|uniref:C2H2-type domain-containing protein n=1 Tax=Sinanodonta woodiana TaxID=1069815 RepID=A0ABD3W0I9_SINWO
MGSEIFHNFISKMKEMANMYSKINKEDQELGLKLLVSICKNFELLLGPGHFMSVCTYYSSKGIEDFFSRYTSGSENAVQDILNDVILDSVSKAEERNSVWPSTRFRERRPTLKTSSIKDSGLAEFDDGDAFDDMDIDEDDSYNHPKRKRESYRRFIGLRSKTSSRVSDKTAFASDIKTRYQSTKTTRHQSGKTRLLATHESEQAILNNDGKNSVKTGRKRGRKPKVKKDSVVETLIAGKVSTTLEERTELGKLDFKEEKKTFHSKSFQTGSIADTFNQDLNLKLVLPVKCDDIKLAEDSTGHAPIRMVAKRTVDGQIVSIKPKRRRGRPPKRQVFSCEKCTETFTHKQSMLNHWIFDHNCAPRSCRLCRKEFMHDVPPEHKCKKYNKSTKICKLCGEECANKTKLKEHMTLEHGIKTREPSYCCKFCKRSFMKRVSLFTHYKDHAEGKFVCIRCGKFCETFENYSSHMAEHEREAKFYCKSCGKYFERAQQYEQHLQAHEQHVCPHCNKSIASQRGLVKHMKAEHGEEISAEERVHKCESCQKMFARPGALMVHMRIHTGEKPVECGACKLFFRTTKALAKHKQTYTHCLKAGEAAKERRFLCNECGKAYFRKHALQRHMHYHTGEKPHMCQYCGYKCREANNLKRHMALHFEAQRNFVCEICGSAFHAKKTLEMHHAYKHNDERAFQCPECPLSFKAKNALRRHSKVHTVDKEHKCWCGTAFKRMYNLRRHLKSVHGTDEMLPPVRRVSTLDCSKKAPVSKTDIIEKFEQPVDIMLREAMLMSPTMVPIPDTLQPSTSSAPSVSMVMMDTRNSTPAPQPPQQQQQTSQQVNGMLQYSIPVSMAEHHHNVDLHHGDPLQQTDSQHHLQASDPHSQHELQPDDSSQRLRYNLADPNLYGNTGLEQRILDPNDPFMQVNTSMGATNIISQAVAYSNIMREYGGQFPFLHDGTVYSQYVK